VPGDQADPDARPWQDIEAGRDAYTAARDLTVHNYLVPGAGQPQSAGPRTRGAAIGPVVVGDIPQEPPGFQLSPAVEGVQGGWGVRR
jgi:hypothetical protein